MVTLRKNQSERGSVMLEFCLVLPIYLLLFGGTFLLFDLSMARLHLQEANRNLAWLQNDRYDYQGKINQTLYENAVQFFDRRNLQEQLMSLQPMWGFGEAYDTYREEANQEDRCVNPDFWGFRLKDDEFNENGVKLAVNNSWADCLGGLFESRLNNDFLALYSGNMELKMEKVSGVYIGAVGVSSILFPADYQSVGDGELQSGEKSGLRRWKETVPLYRSSLTLTRARTADGSPKNAENNGNGEMLVIRRSSGEAREGARTVNDLTPLGTGSQNILFRSWPTNGILGDVSLLLGVGL